MTHDLSDWQKTVYAAISERRALAELIWRMRSCL